MTDNRDRQGWRIPGRTRAVIGALLGIGLAIGGYGGNGNAAGPEYDRKLADGPPAMAYRIQNVLKPWSFSERKGVFRFEVRGGDNIPGDGSDPKERSELYSSAKMDMGRAYRIRFNMLVERGAPNRAAWMTLAQIQSSFDKGEAGHSPPLSIGLKGDRLTIGTNESDVRISTPKDIRFVRRYTDDKDIVRGKWYRFDILLRTASAPDGRLQIRRNDVKIVDVKGQVGFNDVIGPYLKLGVYRAATPARFAIRVKDVSVAPIG